MTVAKLCYACGADVEVDAKGVKHAKPACPAFFAAIDQTSEAYMRGDFVAPTPLDRFIDASPRVSALLARAAALAAHHISHGGAS